MHGKHEASRPDLRLFHFWLTGLTVVIIALSVNRLADFTTSYLQPHQFLRWLDFNAMVPITLASIVLYFGLKRTIERHSYGPRPTWQPWADYLFVLGVCIAGMSSGLHEVTNYLNTRFCDGGSNVTQICQIIAYNDDIFSHILYYIGVVVLNLVLLTLEWRRPLHLATTGWNLLLIELNAAVIALGIFANLAFEPAAIDFVGFGIVVFAADAIFLANLRRLRQLPFTFYIATSYTVGIGAAVAAHLLR